MNEEFYIFHDLYNENCQLNKLLEQSETFANQFYEALGKFKLLKDIESETTTNKQIESCEPIEKLEPEVTKEKIELGDLIKNSVPSEVIVNKNMESFEPIKNLESEVSNNKEIQKLNLKLELDFVLARKKEMTNDGLLNEIESNIAYRKAIVKSNSLKESECEIARRKEMRQFGLTNQIESVKTIKKDMGMFNSLKKTESVKLFESNSLILNKEIAARKEMVELKPMKKTESAIETSKENGRFRSAKEIESESATGNVLKEYKEKHEYLLNKFNNLKNKFGKCQLLIFGKVSTGKSKIINAILGEEIFQSASSHTTSCFVKICKSPDEYHHIEYGNKNVCYNNLDDLKNKIKEMSTVFSNDQNRLETGELLSVYLNIPDNKILTLNTEIIDCPGSANKETITNYIKDKALKANIFIFVLTSGITDDDETFFQYQWKQSSKPIIFILVNKWDQAFNDGEDVAEECKKEISEGLFKFLTGKIQLSPIDVKKRIFFVSALNICKKRNIGKGKSKNLDELEEERCQRFESFERSLSQFIRTFIKQKSATYDAEIKELKKEIRDSTEKFKCDFLNKTILNIDDLRNFQNQIQMSLDNQLSTINVMKENSLNQIRTFVKNYESNLNRSTVKTIENDLNNLIKNNECSYYKLHIDIIEMIHFGTKTYKELTNIDKEKRNPNLTITMMPEINLPTISNTTWEQFCNKFTNFFTFLRESFFSSLQKKDSRFLKETHDKIDLAINELNKSVENYLNALSAYLKEEINEIIDHLSYKINVYSEYSKNIESLFQESNKLVN